MKEMGEKQKMWRSSCQMKEKPSPLINVPRLLMNSFGSNGLQHWSSDMPGGRLTRTKCFAQQEKEKSLTEKRKRESFSTFLFVLRELPIKIVI